jgi:hypothetical protein
LVEHDELMFGLDQAAGHGKAHLPKADESDVHGDVPLGFILNVIARDKREAFAQGSEATKQSILALGLHGLLRGACHRAALRADPLARNDGLNG